MACFLVDYSELTNQKKYDMKDVKDACRQLNNLCDEIAHNGYHVGRRNNIAVDFACLCHVLELDSREVADKVFDGRPVDFDDRLDKIDEYLDDWDGRGMHGVFDFMLMRDQWDFEYAEDKRVEWVECINVED